MEWISCFKEPPPIREWILVWYKTCSGYQAGQAYYNPEQEMPWQIPCDYWDDPENETPWEKKRGDLFDGGMDLSVYAVKYWMPLPDGPDDEEVM